MPREEQGVARAVAPYLGEVVIHLLLRALEGRAAPAAEERVAAEDRRRRPRYAVEHRAARVARHSEAGHRERADAQRVAVVQPVRATRDAVRRAAVHAEARVRLEQRAVAPGVVPVVVRAQHGSDLERLATVLVLPQPLERAHDGLGLARVDERDGVRRPAREVDDDVGIVVEQAGHRVHGVRHRVRWLGLGLGLGLALARLQRLELDAHRARVPLVAERELPPGPEDEDVYLAQPGGVDVDHDLWHGVHHTEHADALEHHDGHHVRDHDEEDHDGQHELGWEEQPLQAALQLLLRRRRSLLIDDQLSSVRDRRLDGDVQLDAREVCGPARRHFTEEPSVSFASARHASARRGFALLTGAARGGSGGVARNVECDNLRMVDKPTLFSIASATTVLKGNDAARPVCARRTGRVPWRTRWWPASLHPAP